MNQFLLIAGDLLAITGLAVMFSMRHHRCDLVIAFFTVNVGAFAVASSKRLGFESLERREHRHGLELLRSSAMKLVADPEVVLKSARPRLDVGARLKRRQLEEAIVRA